MKRKKIRVNSKKEGDDVLFHRRKDEGNIYIANADQNSGKFFS